MASISDKLTPMAGYAIIESSYPKKTAGNFSVATKETLEGYEGVVIAVGPKVEHPTIKGEWIEPNVEVGQRVHHLQWGGQAIDFDGHYIRYVKFTDIVGVITDGSI